MFRLFERFVAWVLGVDLRRPEDKRLEELDQDEYRALRGD